MKKALVFLGMVLILVGAVDASTPRFKSVDVCTTGKEIKKLIKEGDGTVFFDRENVAVRICITNPYASMYIEVGDLDGNTETPSLDGVKSSSGGGFKPACYVGKRVKYMSWDSVVGEVGDTEGDKEVCAHIRYQLP